MGESSLYNFLSQYIYDEGRIYSNMDIADMYASLIPKLIENVEDISLIKNNGIKPFVFYEEPITTVNIGDLSNLSMDTTNFNEFSRRLLELMRNPFHYQNNTDPLYFNDEDTTPIHYHGTNTGNNDYRSYLDEYH